MYNPKPNYVRLFNPSLHYYDEIHLLTGSTSPFTLLGTFLGTLGRSDSICHIMLTVANLQ